jgi:hypothetical protein
MQTLTQKSFKNLPLYLYSFSSQKENTSVLWLPPLGVHKVTESIDWLTGMQISNMMYKPKSEWAPELRARIESLNMPLDEFHPNYKSELIYVSLPPGFRSTLGVIHCGCDWSSAETVIHDYRKATEHFGDEVTVQSLNIWSRPTPQSKIEWIEI